MFKMTPPKWRFRDRVKELHIASRWGFALGPRGISEFPMKKERAVYWQQKGAGEESELTAENRSMGGRGIRSTIRCGRFYGVVGNRFGPEAHRDWAEQPLALFRVGALKQEKGRGS